MEVAIINRIFTIDKIKQSTNSLGMATQTDTKTMLEVYDPAMCCSTGVCGPDVDDEIVDFANDVKWMKSNGVDVKRYNLGQEPEAFKTNPQVLSRLKKEGTECLPLILVNGDVISEGGYPERSQLEKMLEINSSRKETTTEGSQMDPSRNIMTEQVQELVALGAALASNCESCLKFHYKKAKELGLKQEDISQALQIGQNVKQVPAGNMIQLANKLLGVEEQAPANGCAPGSGCC